MTAPLASILTAPGTNRDGDVAFALQLAEFRTEQIDVRQVGSAPNSLRESAAVVVAGGFSYADALGAGRLFALELHHALHDVLQGAIQRGVPVLGICNGFQVLVRLGILPGAGQQAALGHNESGQFACQWVRLAAPPSRCVWTTGLTDGVDCPIAHGEGRFTCDDTTWASLVANEQIALQYTSGNPNGSRGDVAGICDPSGLVLGLMPHPENHVLAHQHPLHSRNQGKPARLGLELLRNGRLHAVA